MFKELFYIFCFVLCINALPAPKPQDPSGMIMMAGMKGMEMIENGASAGNEHEVEFMGAKMGHSMDVGFGEAAKKHRRSIGTSEQIAESEEGHSRFRRSPHSSSSSLSSSSSSSSDSDE